MEKIILKGGPFDGDLITIPSYEPYIDAQVPTHNKVAWDPHAQPLAPGDTITVRYYRTNEYDGLNRIYTKQQNIKYNRNPPKQRENGPN